MPTKPQWVEYEPKQGSKRKSGGESFDRPLKHSRGIGKTPVFTRSQFKKKKTAIERSPEEVFADIFNSQHLFRSPTPPPSQLRTLDSAVPPTASTSLAHTSRSQSPPLPFGDTFASLPAPQSHLQLQRKIPRHPGIQLASNKDREEVGGDVEILTALQAAPKLEVISRVQGSPVRFLHNPVQLPSPPISAEDTHQIDTEQLVGSVPKTSARCNSANLSREFLDSLSFKSSGFELNEYQNTSLFALTPKVPICAINPSLLFLQSAEADIGHNDKEESTDLGPFYSKDERNGLGISKALSTTPKISTNTPAIQPSLLRDDSPASAQTTHTLFNLPSADYRKETTGNEIAGGRNENTDTSEPISTPSNANSAEHAISTAPVPPKNEIEDQYIPLTIHAERDSPNGHELFIEWEDYPLQDDWTWELETELEESVPELIRAWRSSQEMTKTKTEVFIIEKLLDRRNMKGVLYYLVKWKGYDEVNDRTWEPAMNLEIDVPGLVEAFEGRRGERRKRVARGRKVKRERGVKREKFRKEKVEKNVGLVQ